MNQDESVKAFKNELRNYQYYQKRVKDIDEQIELCFYNLGGARGVDPSREPIHAPTNKDVEYIIRDKIERLERSKSLLIDKINYIDSVVDKISDKDMVLEVLVAGKTLESVCGKYYLSKNGLAKIINRKIERALKEL